MIDNTPVVSDAEDASDLEYDENEPMQIDESDDDGSEFEIDSDTEDEITIRPAGRRLAHINAEVEFGFSDTLDHSTSEEEPLALSSKSKGKTGTRATKKAAPFSEDLKQIMDMSQLRAAQREARKALLSSRRANKREEMILRAKLGRRLTHASLLPQSNF